jgi:hypothetical protein
MKDWTSPLGKVAYDDVQEQQYASPRTVVLKYYRSFLDFFGRTTALPPKALLALRVVA